MELLKKLGQFILMQIAILGFLIAAPALFLAVPFVMIANGADSDTMRGVAIIFLFAGPLVSAFWTMIVCMVRRVKRMTNGNPHAYKCSVQGSFAAFGWMLYGFFGTLVAEVAFVLLAQVVNLTPVVWFAAAPFVVFSPLLLLWAWRRLASRGRACVAW
jgi:hypothetical protein